MEWAHELSEDLIGHPSGADKTLLKAIKKGDLDDLRRLCADYSSMLSQEHYYERNILEANGFPSDFEPGDLFKNLGEF
jgi:hypothetical protein